MRERLLDAADRLFYQEGIRAVGVDRVLSEAGAAKASLYSHFGCKDELVAAYAERRNADTRAWIAAFAAEVPPAERALRFFDGVVEWAERENFRGCPMQHVVSELPDASHPARIIATSQRQWLLETITEWTRSAECEEPEQTAAALLVLFNGAIAASEQDGPERARDARWLARKLLAR